MDFIIATVFGAAMGSGAYALMGGTNWQLMLPVILVCSIIGCGIAALTSR